MDSLQFAGHVDLSELNKRVAGVTGPFRGTVWRGIDGRYTRTWLDNGYGLTVCEPYDATGETSTGTLILVPIRHVPGYGETMWTPAYQDGERVTDGAPLWEATVPATADSVSEGVWMLRILAELPGHDMRAVLRDPS
jgi:hypothetical protein